MYRDYRDPVGIVRPDRDGEVLEIDKSFSNSRHEASAGVLVHKDRMFAPYVQAGGGIVDFKNQLDESVLDRDGRDVFATAGVRVRFSPQLHIDLGGRINHRELDDKLVREHTAGFFDGKLVWTPGPRTYVEFNVERTFEEPESAGALFTEQTAAQLYVNLKVSDSIDATISGGYVYKDQIGLYGASIWVRRAAAIGMGCGGR